MNILHTSDLHGNLNLLIRILTESEGINLWIDSGDFFPNDSRGREGENIFQDNWIRKESAEKLKIINDLLDKKGIERIFCCGNHDYVSPQDYFGGWDISTSSQEWAGYRFAGIREIPYIAGEWAGEVFGDDLRKASSRAMSVEPDFLICHAPPSAFSKFGNIPLTSLLFYGDVKVKGIFSGHVHEEGGREQNINGIRFYNAARKPKILSF
jgi:hypothetical protein